MALVVNTNIASITAQVNAVSNRREMETSMERLSSGKRINSAADDAAGLAISTRLDSQIRGMTKGIQNANDAISLTQTAEGAQVEITEMLQRIRELAIQASNSTNNDTDRGSLDSEVQQLLSEIDAIATSTNFNGKSLLNGSFKADIQIGAEVERQMSFSIDSAKIADLGLTGPAGNSYTSLVSDRVSLSAMAAGDIRINGDALGAIAATDEITDVVRNINTNVQNVTATAFNTVTMADVGTGVTTTGQVVIATQLVSTASGSEPFQSFEISASDSLVELAANITTDTQGLVQASVNSEGKLVLGNDTGAAIYVVDQSGGARATGLTTAYADRTETSFDALSSYSVVAKTDKATSDNARQFQGFIKLTTDDGSDIRIDNGQGADGSLGTVTDLEALGLRKVGVNDDLDSTYSITGKALTEAGATGAFEVGDLVINGVDVFNANIQTDTFEGKLNAINAVSSQTGVTASQQFEQFFDLASASGTGSIKFFVNGVTGTTASATASATASTLATRIDTALDTFGLSAELNGTQLRVFGPQSPENDVSSLSIFTSNDAIATANTTIFSTGAKTTAATATGITFAAIQLESTGDRAISIDLGENAVVAEHGFLAMNVGSSDFDSNGTSLGSQNGSTLGQISIGTVTGAEAAVGVVDAAIQQVSSSAAKLGAISNRLDHVVNNLQETIVNTSASKSRILDADFAVESANLAKQQVLQQAATAMLAQANAQPQSVLALLGA